MKSGKLDTNEEMFKSFREAEMIEATQKNGVYGDEDDDFFDARGDEEYL